MTLENINGTETEIGYGKHLKANRGQTMLR